MTGPVTPAAIASVVRSQSISLQEAADLIQHYADQYAAGEVIKAIEKHHHQMMAILEAPTARMRQ